MGPSKAPTRDPEQDCVTDLAGGTGDGDLDGGLAHVLSVVFVNRNRNSLEIRLRQLEFLTFTKLPLEMVDERGDPNRPADDLVE